MYPVMINIYEKPVVVVGGGLVASRKIKTLLAAGAWVTVVSPRLHEAIDPTRIHWVKRPYQTGDLTDAKLVFACTDKDDVNRQVMEEAHPSQLVNNTGDKHFSDFYNVAIARAKDFSVMISTNGLSPARSKEIRKKLETILEEL
ncbi:precorrin-2 dehydrogenase/sirohydrochlorin ferrochelatase family protein [Streptococcus cuniculi]|uniref:precorrin-2 dehydrogenase n=1 Tax=Streptococcus cuniculi TaxID=1432788 RepID=A0A4Y9JDQ8_9STRE|nr:bifunctional precorrin-2 dehydrogenase/sirohydrochlorin ferrochelatase [Streptococcus cuniculi]MBF0777631.1 bifunctional precorrin-2 dehydrogenase/sirohydrochlorin ferrochelatase [Streptococcus cuniculi]TFU98671.1 bifunctional precorrin-2 dehydrogenase/sirohydrochlorin ferrochelatase [Streptococcus cuniculi]